MGAELSSKSSELVLPRFPAAGVSRKAKAHLPRVLTLSRTRLMRGFGRLERFLSILNRSRLE